MLLDLSLYQYFAVKQNLKSNPEIKIKQWHRFEGINMSNNSSDDHIRLLT